MLTAVVTEAPCPKVIVAPHAGYIYSGSVAAQVYARLNNRHSDISRVLLLGPSHRVGFEGIATSSAHFYSTPLGQVALDRAGIEVAESLEAVSCLDEAHLQEHSLEVHLPFLQRCLSQFTLIPLVVGQADPGQVAAVIDKLWGGPETLIVVSSDLSHYLPYDQARSKDADTVALIEQRKPVLTGDQACGCKPLNGLLQLLRTRDLAISTIQTKNSGDTAGPPERVVGYGCWVVEEGKHVADSSTQPEPLPLARRQQLLHIARSVILHGFQGGGDFNIQLNQLHPALREERGSFVTLKMNDRLRGCIGTLVAAKPLVLDVAHNAGAAAFKDHRFKPLTLPEYPMLDIHISVLSPALPLAVDSREDLISKLRPGVDGLILEDGQHRSTYLPSVWQQMPEPETFVSELRAKAGLPKQGWSDTIKVSVYTTEEFA